MSAAATRILGIDPGLQVTGFGVIDSLGTRLGYVTSGCVRTRPGELPQRLRTICHDIGFLRLTDHGVDPAFLSEYFAALRAFFEFIRDDPRRARRPELLIEHAVNGMLPKGRLGRSLRTKLKVYAGDKHPHTAQVPATLVIKK